MLSSPVLTWTVTEGERGRRRERKKERRELERMEGRLCREREKGSRSKRSIYIPIMSITIQLE